VQVGGEALAVDWLKIGVVREIKRLTILTSQGYSFAALAEPFLVLFIIRIKRIKHVNTVTVRATAFY